MRQTPFFRGALLRVRDARILPWLAGMALLLCALLWPQAALAQVASPRCPTPFTLSIAHSGSGVVNANACHEGFGIGFLMVAPLHGTVTIDTLASTVTYAHNGNSATSDSFRFDDGSGFFVQVNVTIGPASTITIAPASLPALTAGTPMSQALVASGGIGPYTYTLDSGTLPTGLSLSPGGVLSGTPTQRGPFAFSVRATDATLAFGARSYNPTVAGGTLSLAPNPPPNAVVSVPYSATLTPSGGVAPMSMIWEPNPSFPLPPGLSLSGNTLSGTPTTQGTYTFGIRITDSSTGPGSWFQVINVTMTVTPPPTIVVNPSSLPAGSVGAPYNQALSGSGGAAPYGLAVTAGALPAGLTLASNGTLSGTPTAGGTFNFTATATDNNGFSGSRAYALIISPATIAIAPTSLPSGTLAVPYSQSITASGGTSPHSFAVTAGAMPAGMSLTSAGLLSGTPTSSGTFNFTVTATDSSTGSGPYSGSRAYSLTIAAPAITLAPVTLPNGTVGVAYSQAITASGGTAPYGFAVTAGALPAGFALASDGTLSGTPAAGGTFNFTITATDDNTLTGSRAYSLTINAPTITVAPTTLPAGTLAAAYSQQLTSSGGTLPHSFAVTAGAIPAGMSLTSAGLLGGTPTASGTFNFTVTATDSSTGSGPYTGSRAYSLTIAAPVITLAPATLPGAQVGSAYSQAITADGGTSPYSVAITAGALPAGLTLSSTGALSGTPTAAGTFNFTATATDSSTGSGPHSGSRAYTLTVAGAAVVLAPATLANGAIGAAYSDTVTASGGTAPYTFSINAGALPPGLSLSSAGALTGTPTAAGTFNFTLAATDSSTGTGPFTGAQAYSVTIADITPVANAVSATVAQGSGANPITLNITGGVPTSVAIASAPANGTAIASATSITYQPSAGFSGSDSFTYTATNSAGTSAPATVSVTVAAPTLSITPAGPLGGVVGATFTQVFTFSGGTAPYSGYAVSGLPAGLGVTATGTDSVTVSGTPTAAGTFNLTVSGTDSSTGNGPFTASQAVSLTVNAPSLTLSPGSGTVSGSSGVAFSQAFTVTGGTPPYTYAITAGALPPGLTFDAATGVLSGTPTASGSFPLTITATDSSSGAGAPFSVSSALTVQIAAVIVLDPATLPGGLTTVAYTQTITASGGTAPYLFSLDSGVLPPGLALASNGTLSGVPTVAGSYTFTVSATDFNARIGTRAYSVVIATPPTIVLAPAALPDGLVGTAYAQTISASGGTGPYGFSLLSGALPVGLSFSSAGVLSGTPVAAGTFNFTVRASDANGFTGDRAYALTIVAPTITIAPATLPDGVAGTAYSQAFAASGGTAPYSYSLASGALPVGMSFTGAGVLSGTPAAAGAFNFTVRATDANGFTADQVYALTIAAPTIVIAPATLPDAAFGVAYSQTITASGGTGPYTYSLPSGSLPVGISFSSAGVLSGTPAAGGTFNFTVRATDANGFSADLPSALTVVVPTIVLAPAALPGGVGGVPYSQPIVASGGTAPYAFSLVSGALPAGVGLSSTGVVSGTPTAPGSHTFVVRATDANGVMGEQSYTVAISAPTITLTPATLPDANHGVAYAQALAATGGTGPYAFSVLAGTLPPGIAMSSAGVLSGTSIVGGTSDFTVQATDANGFTGQQAYSITLVVPSITITPATLPDATGGTAYSQALAVTGGTAPYTFALQSGAFPLGINMTGAGDIAGVPLAAGTSNFIVRVTDATGFSVDQAFSLTVLSPTIAITPAALSNGTVGLAYSQALSAAGGNAPYTFGISGGSLPTGLALAGDGSLSGTPSAAGSFAFEVTATDSLGFTGVQGYVVAVAAAPPVAVDDAASTDAGTPVAIAVTANDTGSIDSIAVASAPSNGTATVVGLEVTYTPAAGFFGADSFTYTAIGPGGASNAATVTIDVRGLPVPVGVPQTVTTLAGQAVSFDAAAGASGAPFTGVTLLATPSQGEVQASGTTITYTPAVDASGTVTIGYTLDNPFGSSAPITSTVVVNPLPMAAAHNATTLVGVAVDVVLTQGASGGPFTAADVVTVSPADAGTTQVTAAGPADAREYVLTFTPDSGFLGTAEVTYTLANAYATSAPAVVSIDVTQRPDPTQDAEVLGLLAAQNAATKRFAHGQIDNFQSRMERLHGTGAGQGFDNGLSVSIARHCLDGSLERPGQRCADEALAAPGSNGAAPPGHDLPAGDSDAPVGIWTAGAMAFGDHDLRGTGNGFEFETSAISAGVDYRLSPTLVLGAGVGYGRDVSDVGDNGTRSKASAGSFAVYGSHEPAPDFFVDLLLGYQNLSFESRRHVSATGGLVTGDRDGDQWFGSLSATYERRDERYTLAPYLRWDVARATLDAFTEQGDPVYALHYGEQDVDTTTGNLGLRLETHHKLGWSLLSPLLRLEYQHDFEDPGVATLNYADLFGGPFYRTRLPRQDYNRFLFGVGAILQTERDWLLKAEYRSLFGNADQDEHSIMLNIEKQF